MDRWPELKTFGNPVQTHAHTRAHAHTLKQTQQWINDKPWPHTVCKAVNKKTHCSLFFVTVKQAHRGQRSQRPDQWNWKWMWNGAKLNNRSFCGYSSRMWLRAGDLRSLNNKEIEKNKFLFFFAIFVSFMRLSRFKSIYNVHIIWLHGENKSVRNVNWEANQWYIMYDFIMPVSSISKAFYKLTGNHETEFLQLDQAFLVNQRSWPLADITCRHFSSPMHFF